VILNLTFIVSLNLLHILRLYDFQRFELLFKFKVLSYQIINKALQRTILILEFTEMSYCMKLIFQLVNAVIDRRDNLILVLHLLIQ
jgi:hypothetical protein